MFEYFIDNPAKKGEPIDPLTMWLLVGLMGVISFVGLIIYNKVMKKEIKNSNS